MQGKGGVEKINIFCRKKPPVERARHAGGEVRTAVAFGIRRWKELKEGVEVVRGEVAEEGGELRRRLVPRRLVTLAHVLDHNFHHVYGVDAAGAAQIRHHESAGRRAQPHAVESFTQKVEH